MTAPSPPTVPGLIDAHCHLDYPPMADDVRATLTRAAMAGVQRIVHVGCSLARLESAIDLARTHPEVFAVIGIHPHDAVTVDEAALTLLRHLAIAPEVVAIGETGLDYHYDRSPRDRQRTALAQHAELARELNLPLVLHVRDAHEEAMEVLDGTPLGSQPGMVHCFTGGPDQARQWLDRGFFLSFSGIATFPNATAIHDAVRLCPTDRIMLETDAPYLAPVPVRGRKNEPANLAFTCARLAALRQTAPATLAGQASANTRMLFRLPDAPAPQTAS